MGRIRAAFISGSLDAELSAAATSFTDAALASLPAIASPDIAALILDPLGVNGAPEIAWVIAHTSRSQTATLLRAQEGTAARIHPSGSSFKHGPTTLDYARMQPKRILRLTNSGTYSRPNDVR